MHNGAHANGHRNERAARGAFFGVMRTLSAGPEALQQVHGSPHCLGGDAVPASGNDDDFGIGRLRELERRLYAAPTQIRIRDSLADDLLEFTDPFRLDLLALRLFSLARDTKRVFL